jgi:P4 family phage/plasmid primase-like protien
MSNVEVAKSYLEEFKLVCFPIRRGTKTPLLSGYLSLTVETVDLNTFQPDSGIGILAGPASQVIVVDIDAKDCDGKISGVTKWNEWLVKYNQSVDINTPTVETPSGGRHVYFRYTPAVAALPKSITIKDQQTGKPVAIDLFTDNKGFLVAPPSVHPNGGTYVWSIWPDVTPFAEMPEWLINELTIATTKTKPAAGVQVQVDDELVQKALDLFHEKSPDAQNFDFRRVINNVIQLDRNCKEYCNLCQRQHADDLPDDKLGDNAFLTLVGENQLIYYHCHENKKLLGRLAPFNPSKLDSHPSSVTTQNTVSSNLTVKNEMLSASSSGESQKELGELFVKLICGDVVIHNTRGPMFMWNKETKLWREEENLECFPNIVSDVLEAHLEKERKVCQSLCDSEQDVAAMSENPFDYPEYVEEFDRYLAEVMQAEGVEYPDEGYVVSVKDEWLALPHVSQFILDVKVHNEQVPHWEENKKKLVSRLTKTLQKIAMVRTITPLRGIAQFAKAKLIDSSFSDKLNSKSFLLPIKEGKVFNIENGQVEERLREHYFTREFPVSYKPNAKSDKLDNFLKDLMRNNDEMVEFLKDLIGYFTTGDISMQYILFFTGGGSNGKTTFMEMLAKVFGQFYSDVHKCCFMDSGKKTSLSPELASMEAVRVACCNELKDNDVLDDDIVKKMTGGNKVPYRPLYGSVRQLIPHCKCVIITNLMPQINFTDRAIYRRVIIVPFEAHYYKEGEESYEHSKPADTTLMEVLKNDQDVLEALFAITVERAMKFFNTKSLKLPEKVRLRKEEEKTNSDIVFEFLETSTVQRKGDNQLRCKTPDLYKAYCKYATDNQRKVLKQSDFNNLIESLGFPKKKNSTYYFYGIAVGVQCEHGQLSGSCPECLGLLAAAVSARR